MIRRPPRSTLSSSSAASDVYKRQPYNMAKQNGTCKWFDSKKGFGFIAPADGGEDLFVHQTGIVSDGFRKLVEGEEVIYDIQKDDGGRTKAVNVEGPAGGNVTNKGTGRERRRKSDDEEEEEEPKDE
eukprot:TRINITY_DN1368_c0_g1_i5.p2 TRINITY_DN1368_c0_g1~~TRINITY_DN1368_c0_g1_i5.p2  ORF type:complete len:127 (+),score=38.50 TRINITY_DN1368_c0_g1_i5:112-492(+)